ncbi:MAG: hypothetical protein ACLP7Q_15070 [Isosphaeraceae bacterium]
MKTALSHLQFENEQLRTEVAKLKEENRGFEDRLVQEQIHNGDLAAQLDDVRNALRDRGVDPETRLGSRGRELRSDEPDEPVTRPRMLPAGRTGKKPRKPPAASISGDLDNLPRAPDDRQPDDTISLKTSDTTPSRGAIPGDSASVLGGSGSLRWHPVASGSDFDDMSRR